MSQQRPFTVQPAHMDKLDIVWTRDKSLARAWAAENYKCDPVHIDVWPTTQEDQEQLKIRGGKEYYA